MHDLATQLRVIPPQLIVLCWHGAGVYDEKVLVGLDFVLNEASKRGIRAVLVLANYWAMYGGIDQYNIWSFEAGSGELLPLGPVVQCFLCLLSEACCCCRFMLASLSCCVLGSHPLLPMLVSTEVIDAFR